MAETGEKFLLRQRRQSCGRNWQRQKQKSQSCGRNWRKVPSTAETEDKPTLQRLSLNLDSMFAHKPDQIELQLDWSQLPYSEYLSLVPQEVAQPSITQKAHYIKLATPLGSWDQDGENEIFLLHKCVSKSLPKKVSKRSQRYHSRILWRNITATLQQNSVTEFCDRILQQRYNRTVSQQNFVAEHNNI